MGEELKMPDDEKDSKRRSKRVILDKNGFIVPEDMWEESGFEYHGALKRDLPPEPPHLDSKDEKAAPPFEQITNIPNIPHHEVGRIKCPYCNKRFSIIKFRGHMRKVHHAPKSEIDRIINDIRRI
jgi:hypothetical protein